MDLFHSVPSTPSSDRFRLPNKSIERRLQRGEDDFIYHLAVTLSTIQTADSFGDVRYVCVGGTANRMRELAAMCSKALSLQSPDQASVDLCGTGARYAMYKAGPVLCVSHGMGNPSISILLNELFKLLHYAKATRDVKFFRIGTCGGVGVPPGTTIVTEKVFNGVLGTDYVQFTLGKAVRRPAVLSAELSNALWTAAQQMSPAVPVVRGNTLCTDDFFEGQARTDGAFCQFSDLEAEAFLRRCHDAYGIRNIEMESLAFAALTHQANVAGTVVCVAFIDRLDPVTVDPARIKAHSEEWQQRPLKLVTHMIASSLMDRR